MSAINPEIESLRKRIETPCDVDFPADGQTTRLSIVAVGELVELDFYGEPFSEAYLELLELLSKPNVAASVRSLSFRGPDAGANGTTNWDIEPLLEKDATFPHLEYFAIQLTQPSDHNHSIVGASFDENGVLARLLRRAPQIRSMTIPSAPNSNFFDEGTRPLRFLSVDAGYDTQGFIGGLADSQSFPELKCLEWGEYHETYLENWQTNSTPFTDYERLFRSAAFSKVTRFVWRNPVCSAEQIKKLKTLRPDLQMLVVQFNSEYV